MIYYAGHGIEINGSNYLVPVDAKLRDDRVGSREARGKVAVEGRAGQHQRCGEGQRHRHLHERTMAEAHHEAEQGPADDADAFETYLILQRADRAGECRDDERHAGRPGHP
ncbi:hypothetical protein, partial [Undibacterium luofuense]|uniref:hypothetical protein n=1 Tax=Undibacterium luofuense TaxID=2828733 RepID=UPI003C7034BE